MILKNLINENYLTHSFIEKTQKEILTKKPFPHLSLNNFLIQTKAEEIFSLLNTLHYYKQENDLYSFYRTTHFKYIPNPKIQKLISEIFNDKFITYIEKLTNTKLNRNKKEIHSLKFTKTDYLLCHDDKVEGRKIAFIINLSKNWTKHDGGNLELFDINKEKFPNKIKSSIQPQFNQFNLFIVSDISYHQVSEILTDKERISLAGWFYEK